MARVDKTESAIGVTRGTLKTDVAEADYDKVLAVGIDSAGLVVLGAGQTGIVGVAVFDRTNHKAGKRVDIIGNGSELVDCAGLAAGTRYTANTTTGVVSSAAAGATQIAIGFTVEADRLVVTI